ncbi:hypothetical protein PoB_004406200 [Plakobranchus ocellatus]|uniref:Uncharacterized protein n=1 Tax=Plakobranchus ocellatus TaxID=259542 RepID=A0AAV4BDN6_9GAST|nr:hypothetical protein PoB_004406200 [Plakobranchus ocellatus]
MYVMYCNVKLIPPLPQNGFLHPSFVNTGDTAVNELTFDSAGTLCRRLVHCSPRRAMHGGEFESALRDRGGVGGTVASESALRSAGTLLSRFEPRHQHPGLSEGLKT